VKTLVWSTLGAAGQRAALARPGQRSDPELRAAVQAIVEDVRLRGWEGLCAQAVRLDGTAPRLVAVRPLADEARRRLAPEQVEAIALAAANIRDFHEGSLPAEHAVETLPGLAVRKIWRPIDRIGLYIPAATRRSSRRC
jgi:histidinol dehydrogenase